MMDEQGRIGFADSSGNVVIHPQFSYATPFVNGHAYVTEHGGESNEREHTTWQSDKWKIINRNGNELLEYTVIREEKAVKGLLIRYFHPSGSIRTLTYTYPEDIAYANNFHAEVTLKDLNFDGQDDIAIPLGNYGNQRIQYEDGYLWDKTQKTYVSVKQLKEIANPRIDKEERCLFSFSANRQPATIMSDLNMLTLNLSKPPNSSRLTVRQEESLSSPRSTIRKGKA